MVFFRDRQAIGCETQVSSMLETRVYAVLQPVRNVAPLIDQLTRTVAPESWEHVGGPGSIEAWPGGALVVAHTLRRHLEIEQAGRSDRVTGQATSRGNPIRRGVLVERGYFSGPALDPQLAPDVAGIDTVSPAPTTSLNVDRSGRLPGDHLDPRRGRLSCPGHLQCRRLADGTRERHRHFARCCLQLY